MTREVIEGGREGGREGDREGESLRTRDPDQTGAFTVFYNIIALSFKSHFQAIQIYR